MALIKIKYFHFANGFKILCPKITE